MGDSPPIPVDPVQSVPEAVLHQTPRPGYQQPGLPPPGQNDQNQGQTQGGAFAPQGPNVAGMSDGYPSQPQQPQFSNPSNRYPTPPQLLPQAGRQDSNNPNGQQSMSQQPYPPSNRPQMPGQYLQEQGQGPYMAPAVNHSIHPQVPQPSQLAQHQQMAGMQPNHQQPMGGPYQTPHTQLSNSQPMMPGSREQQHFSSGNGNRQPDEFRGNLQHSKSQAAPSRNQSSGRQGDHRRAASLTVPARADTTDSYLDRVENDPKLRSMLSGAPTRTIHTGVPLTGSSVMSGTDKPLPNPQGKSKRSASHRQSLLEGLHGQHATAHINSGDRYPNFPVNGKGHSRQPSFDSAEPPRRTHES